MERLTKRDFVFSSNYVASKLQSWSISQALKKLQQYENAEEDGMIISLPCKVGGVVLVDSRTLPTHRLDVDEEEIPEYFKATVVSIRQNSKGWFFKVSILAKWLTPVWDDECGSYEIGIEKMRYFTYHASAIGKTVFLSHEEAEAALAERKASCRNTM